MIAASALLVVVAFVTLILGIFQTGLGLIWVSIASSVGAAITLLLGVVQSRPKVAVAGGPGVGEPAQGAAVLERPEAPPWQPEPEASETTAVLEPVAEAEPEPPARAPAPRRRTSAEATVVVIPDRDKYHKETCRYARSPAAMTLTKAQARRQGYKQCGICKP